MADLETEQRKRELIRSVNWWVFVSSGLAGAIGGSTLFWLRFTDQLPSDEYTYTRIILLAFAIGVVMPIALTTAFHVTAMPSMKVWIERLGALILFIVIPAIVLLGVVQWIVGH